MCRAVLRPSESVHSGGGGNFPVLHIFIIVVYLRLPCSVFFALVVKHNKVELCVRGKNNATENKIHKKENDRTDNEPWSTLSSDGNTMCRVLDFSHDHPDQTVRAKQSPVSAIHIASLSDDDDRASERRVAENGDERLIPFHRLPACLPMAPCSYVLRILRTYWIDFARQSTMMLMVKKFSFHSQPPTTSTFPVEVGAHTGQWMVGYYCLAAGSEFPLPLGALLRISKECSQWGRKVEANSMVVHSFNHLMVLGMSEREWKLCLELISHR